MFACLDLLSATKNPSQERRWTLLVVQHEALAIAPP